MFCKNLFERLNSFYKGINVLQVLPSLITPLHQCPTVIIFAKMLCFWVRLSVCQCLQLFHMYKRSLLTLSLLKEHYSKGL